LGSTTWLNALSLSGTPEKNLLAQAAWAKLNADATSDGTLTGYPLYYDWIIAMVNAALASGSSTQETALATFLQNYNVNLSPNCPFTTTTTTSSSFGIVPIILLNLPGVAAGLRKRMTKQRKPWFRYSFTF
jgi:hypothetical protein